MSICLSGWKQSHCKTGRKRCMVAASAGREKGDVIGGKTMMPGNELLAETAGQKELHTGCTVVPN